MQGVEERSFLMRLIGKVVVERVDKGVTDEHQIGLKICDLFPSVAKQNLFESIHLTFEDSYAKLRSVEDVPEGQVGLIAEQYRNAAAKRYTLRLVRYTLPRRAAGHSRVDAIDRSTSPPGSPPDQWTEHRIG